LEKTSQGGWAKVVRKNKGEVGLMSFNDSGQLESRRRGREKGFKEEKKGYATNTTHRGKKKRGGDSYPKRG
jgi:hypothetical protein